METKTLKTYLGSVLVTQHGDRCSAVLQPHTVAGCGPDRAFALAQLASELRSMSDAVMRLSEKAERPTST